MTATAHAVTGAAVALAVKRPEAAIPAAFISHFVIDAIPHFKVAGDVLERNTKKLFWVGNGVDIVLAACLLVLLPGAVAGTVAASTIFWCMLLAISPDFPWVYSLYKEMKSRQFSPGNLFSRFHSWIQWKEKQWGIWVELAWILLMTTVIIRLKS